MSVAARRSDGDAVTVSVIVPTLDSERSLARCLASVKDRQGVELETIVVDQGSADGTDQIVRKAGARLISLPRPRVYTPPTRSRNVGAKAARGEYLLHLDADMELMPGMLEACVTRCAEEGHVALVLHEVDRAAGFWAKSKALERRCYWGAEEIEGARFVRTDAFWSAGGYDERLGSGEDWDVHRRYASIGSIGRGPTPLVHDLGSITFTKQIRKKFSYGRTARPFLRGAEPAPILGGMFRAYWRSRALLARHPAHAVGFLVLRTAEVMALTAGMAMQAVADAGARNHAGAKRASGANE
jgi:glycosyltransferase involved in cell wall biosynthesis